MASKLEITELKGIFEGDNRQIIVNAVCAVRGDVQITFSEEDARWFWASMDPKVKAWRQADGEDD
ncbi:hypothetical protein AB0G42_21600 [Streptomyces yangpuensis]|uniref:hypothetical protein n=1 Tax=Streptomyces yangpuensis TaxID=1648182 RepID=UPI00342753DE